MNKKGFTLVELLAVIVILAIIALIATPLILNVIDNAKKGAVEASANGYIDALEKGIVIDYSLKIDKYVINYENGTSIAEKGTTLKDIPKVCKLSNDIDGNGLADISDEITCGTESFYVYSNDGTNIKMLSKYNLNISKGIQSVDSSDKLQYSSGSSTYEDSSIKNYVDGYKSYLEGYGIMINEATIITKEEIETFAEKTLAVGDKLIDVVPSFIYSTSYWTRTIDNSIRIYRIDPSGGIYTDFCTESTGTGLRPVIIIPTTEI